MPKLNNVNQSLFFPGGNSSSKVMTNHLRSPSNENILRADKSPNNKLPKNSIKSPNYKTPLKSQQVTNFSNINSPNNVDLNKTYDKIIQYYTPISQQISPKGINSKDKKRRISLSNYNNGINKKLKTDTSPISPTSSNNNKNRISTNFKNSQANNINQNQGKWNIGNIGNTNQLKKTNKFVNLSNTFEKMNDNFKETKYTRASTINNIQNQYSNFINSFENKEYSQLTSPSKDWNSKNLLSSYVQQNLKFVKNGYSEKLVNIITKKRSNFHIWLHSIQKSESINDMFKNTIIVEVKQASILNSNIEMKCRLIASFHVKFSDIYRKEGGRNSLDVLVLTNIHRSWPSQKNIENFKIKKLLKDFKENNKHDTDSLFSKKQLVDNNTKQEVTEKVTLCEKSIQNGTLLIIKEPKTILHNHSTLSKVNKKTLVIYNDLFLIFNV